MNIKVVPGIKIDIDNGKAVISVPIAGNAICVTDGIDRIACLLVNPDRSHENGRNIICYDTRGKKIWEIDPPNEKKGVIQGPEFYVNLYVEGSELFAESTLGFQYKISWSNGSKTVTKFVK